MGWEDFDKVSMALCMWREARGEGVDGMRAVGHVINNRAIALNKSWAQIVYAKLQFSSMTYPQDPQLSNVPTVPDTEFVQACQITDAITAGTDPDLTGGARYYFADSIPTPDWAKNMVETSKIGRQTFFKEA